MEDYQKAIDDALREWHCPRCGRPVNQFGGHDTHEEEQKCKEATT